MKPLPLVALLLTAGCVGSGLSAEQQKERCTDFASAVAKAGLESGTPTEQVARDVANSLDSRLSRLGSPTVHDAAVKLHQDLHAVELALKRGNQARADEAAASSREDIDDLARACDLPAEDFLGG